MSHSNYWCNIDEISMDEIDRRANHLVQNGHFPTLVYISSDLYTELQKSMMGSMRLNAAGQQQPMQAIMSIMTSVGSLNFQQVRRLRNFLMVGRKEDFEAFTSAGVDPIFWSDQEKVRIDKAFEDLIIMEGNDET